MRKGWMFLLLLLVTGLLMNACSKIAPEDVDKLSQETISESKPVLDYSDPETYVTLGSLDETFVKLGKKIEGFSRLYFDENKRLIVGVSTPVESALTRSDFIVDTITQAFDTSLTEEVAKTRSGEPIIAFKQQAYSFKELNAWKNHASKLVRQGVTLIDADEVKNKVVVGVESEKAKSEVLQAYKELKLPIPEDALEILIVPPAELTADNRDTNRPVVGGLRIYHYKNNQWWYCTLSFNATRFGVKGFITNSHCSSNFGWPDATVQDQVSARIGYELHDPSFDYSAWPWVCPWGFRCRYSDSAFYRYDPGVTNLGHVADVTYYYNMNAGSHTYNQTRNVSSSSYSNSVSGSTVFKVGATTGGTTGSVIITCTGILSTGGTNTWLNCQDSVSMLSRPGDSGSPVFARPCGTCDVKAYGVLWGKNPVLERAYVSPIHYVLQELNLSISTF